MNLNDKSLMIIDDDDIFRNRLITAMKRKGYEAYGASSVSEAKSLVNSSAPKYAVIDLRLNDGNGLEVVSVLSNKRPDSKIVMLTGYGNIPTACLLYTSPSPRDMRRSRMPSSA